MSAGWTTIRIARGRPAIENDWRRHMHGVLRYRDLPMPDAVRPQLLGHFEWVDSLGHPPAPLIAHAVQCIVMHRAQGDGKFVTYFLAKTSPLRKTDVVCVRGLATADQAGLEGNELEMRLAA